MGRLFNWLGRQPRRCGCALALALACLASTVAAAPPAGYDLVWSDEFDGDEIDPRNWTRFRDDNGFQAGFDRTDATSIGNGQLTIAAYSDLRGLHYTGSLITRERESFHYGYFETRIRFRGEAGLNQAFWVQSPTMPIVNGNVPGYPDIYGTEIDVVEHRAYDGSSAYIGDVASHGLHWDGYAADHKSSGGLSPAIFGDLNNSWHTYALEWTPAGYKYFVDGVLTRNTTVAVSARDHHVILSNAIFPAGNWTPGPPPGGYGPLEDGTYGMDVDYVRVYANPQYEVTRADQIVSLNFVGNGAGANQVPAAYGVPAESSVTDGWLNLNTSVGVVGGVFAQDDLTYSDGRRSPVDVSVNLPYATEQFSDQANGTPMKMGLVDYVSSPNSVEVTLTELDHAYESGYKVIAYLTGYAPNTGASISAGATTYYFQTPDPATSDLLQTTDTDPLDGIPEANFAVFGTDFDPLFDSSLTLTLDTLDFVGGHAPALGGLQIVPAKRLFGDFNRDGLITALDIDLLTGGLGRSNPEFNLNNFTDAVVDDEDRRLWLNYAAGTTFGDANLDGTVDQADLQILADHLQGFAHGWAGADFNGDNVTDQADLDVAEANWDPSGPLTFEEAALAVGLTLLGDFNHDGQVDGADLLKWQRDGLGTGKLGAWQASYGVSAAAHNATSVPEPASLAAIAMLSVGMLLYYKLPTRQPRM